MFRDLDYYGLRLAIYVALAIGLATLFANLGSSYGSIQVKCERKSLFLLQYKSVHHMT